MAGRTLAAASLAAAVVSLGSSSSSQAGLRVSLVDTAVIAAAELGELSGLAPSDRRGVYWGVNDSGNEPLLFALDSAGQDLGSVLVAGATNIDWEDLDQGPCFSRPGRCLYIADIGDNSANRGSIQVYRVPLPEPPGAGTRGRVSVLDVLELRYPDRPRNAEGLVVSESGWLAVVTKELFDPPVLFRASAAPSRTPVVLDAVTQLPMTANAAVGRQVTGAALSADGELLVTRTYVSLHAYRLRSTAVPLTQPAGLAIPVVESQGEAITFGARDELVLGSERGTRGHAIIQRLRFQVELLR